MYHHMEFLHWYDEHSLLRDGVQFVKGGQKWSQVAYVNCHEVAIQQILLVDYAIVIRNMFNILI